MSKLKVGDRVVHDIYGPGIVIELAELGYAWHDNWQAVAVRFDECHFSHLADEEATGFPQTRENINRIGYVSENSLTKEEDFWSVIGGEENLDAVVNHLFSGVYPELNKWQITENKKDNQNTSDLSEASLENALIDIGISENKKGKKPTNVRMYVNSIISDIFSPKRNKKKTYCYVVLKDNISEWDGDMGRIEGVYTTREAANRKRLRTLTNMAPRREVYVLKFELKGE